MLSDPARKGADHEDMLSSYETRQATTAERNAPACMLHVRKRYTNYKKGGTRRALMLAKEQLTPLPHIWLEIQTSNGKKRRNGESDALVDFFQP